MDNLKKRKIDAECRKFNNEWRSKFLFIEIGKKAVCLVCREEISVFKEYNLRRHYISKHENTYKNLSVAEMDKKASDLANELQLQQNFFTKQSATEIAITKASFVVAYNIAQNSKSFMDGEFIKKCMVDVAGLLVPEKKKLFENISLSRRTTVRRIAEISDNLFLQLKTKVECFTYFALALDESCDIMDTAQLLIFIRGINSQFEIVEELAGLQPIKSTTKGEDLLQEVNMCCEKLKIKWNQVINITTDGSPNLTGKHNGLLRKINDQMRCQYPDNEIVFLHCIIHQEVLCKGVLKLNHVEKVIRRVINALRGSALSHRQFCEFLKDFDCNHSDVRYHTNVRWLSLGNVLKRINELLAEIILFLDMKEKLVDFPELTNNDWLNDFAFAVDIMVYLNDLNTKLQGKEKFVHNMFSEVKSFMTKLKLFEENIVENQLDHFPTLQLRKDNLGSENLNRYASIISALHSEFLRRFQDFKKIEKFLNLVSLPFSFDVAEAPSDIQLELIDLQCDPSLRDNFCKYPLLEFYNSLKEEKFGKLKNIARKYLVMFGSTYICEKTFSLMKYNKSQYRSNMTDENLQSILRTATSELKPDIDGLVKNQQRYHPSH